MPRSSLSTLVMVSMVVSGFNLFAPPPARAQTPSSQAPTAPPNAPSTPAVASAPRDPNTGRLTLTASFDAVSTYLFRGLRQHSTGMALWPAADVEAALYSGDGGIKHASIDLATWNSLNTGDTGAAGPTGKVWYEGDFYATFTLGLAGSTNIATTYSAYTSPNNAFSSVKEVSVTASFDDAGKLGKASLKPYVLAAFEFDTSANTGQADNGLKAGRYLELGITPGYGGKRASLSVPVKVGFSLSHYYELYDSASAAPSYVDHKFGFFSVAGVVTMPLGDQTDVGSWDVHGGVEVQALGTTTKAFNGGEKSRVIASIGIGFTY